jgi:AAA ATPase domain
LPGPLGALAQKFKKAQLELNGLKLPLPLDGFFYEYDEQNDVSYVIGEGYKIDLLEASSGLQSSIPLYLVSRNLSNQVEFENVPSVAPVSANQSIRRDREISAIMQDKSLTSAEKDKKAEEVFAKYHNKCFINIIEEPEQNLFPRSQRKMLESLSKFNNMNEGNKLVLTTHSPYIINFLSIAIQGDYLVNKLKDAKRIDLIDRVKNVIPLESCIKANDVIIYELNEKGAIIKLDNYEGIPSDKNYLNASLAECNELFDSLLEIEQEI